MSDAERKARGLRTGGLVVLAVGILWTVLHIVFGDDGLDDLGFFCMMVALVMTGVGNHRLAKARRDAQQRSVSGSRRH